MTPLGGAIEVLLARLASVRAESSVGRGRLRRCHPQRPREREHQGYANDAGADEGERAGPPEYVQQQAGTKVPERGPGLGGSSTRPPDQTTGPQVPPLPR